MNYDFPKIDLHLHLDGSMLPETAWDLAQSQGIDMPADNLESFREFIVVSADCRDVNEYLRRFDLPLQLLQTGDALTRVSRELVSMLAKQGLAYAEIRFAPQQHMKAGLTQDDATAAVLRGMREGQAGTGIGVGLLLCAMSYGDASLNREENVETVRTADRFRDKGVVGVDLAGYEGMCPVADFAYVFREADKYGLARTVHAGDSMGPQSVRDALSFGTKRIGHGHRSSDDPALVKRLIEEGITLEVCPTSNIQCQTQPSYEAHPLKRLFDAGVRVTVNTDNMVLSNIDLDHEYDICIEKMGFSRNDLIRMNIYSAEAAFMAADKRDAIISELQRLLDAD